LVLPAALEQIEKCGSLLRSTPDRAQRLRLMKEMSEQSLVVWNSTAAKYELTMVGLRCLAEYQETINSRQRGIPA
jgi:hypothetical protein